MDRSALGVSVSVSVLVLLPDVGSVTPAGGITVAVLLSVPVSVWLTVTVSRKPSVSPVAGVPVVKLPVLVRVLWGALFGPETRVVPAGKSSLPLAPVMVLGPLLVTMIV